MIDCPFVLSRQFALPVAALLLLSQPEASGGEQ